MKINSFISLRYLRNKKKNSILSFLSLTSIIGVTLGVAALILVINVMSGFSDNLRKKMMGANPDILITDYASIPIEGYKPLMKEVAEIEGVKSVAPFINAQAVISTPNGANGVLLRGVDDELEDTVSSMASFMIYGKLRDLAPADNFLPGIFLGNALAFTLRASIGDVITLISPQTIRGPFGINPKMRRFEVKGIFDMGVHEYNSTLAYIHIDVAREFIGLEEKQATGLSVAAMKGIDPITLASKISKEISRHYYARDWLSMNTSLFSALKLEQYAMFIILTLIIIVASFSIISMVSITVKDKVRDIAILRAYGASTSLIRSIFLRQGFLVGLIGTAIGNLIAFILSILVVKYKLISIPAEVYFMDSLPMNMDLSVYLLVSICAIIITFLASLFPAHQASKMPVVDGLRND